MNTFILTIALVFLTYASTALVPGKAMNVVVTGASGRTGMLVFKELLEHPDFEPKALVRSTKSGKKLQKIIPHLDLGRILVADVTQLQDDPVTQRELSNCQAMVICTSAVPQIRKRSLVKTLLLAPIQKLLGKPVARSLSFRWQAGQTPQEVDYHGQIQQINLAKQLGMKRVVVVSSMGGTDPENFLNQIGRQKDGSGGDILLWKRRAEKYLIDSGLTYSIVHPGGLVDKTKADGTNPRRGKFVLDVNDKLYQNKQQRSISRQDVADLCVASLLLDDNIVLDCVTREDAPVRSAHEALQAFVRDSSMVYSYDDEIVA